MSIDLDSNSKTVESIDTKTNLIYLNSNSNNNNNTDGLLFNISNENAQSNIISSTTNILDDKLSKEDSSIKSNSNFANMNDLFEQFQNLIDGGGDKMEGKFKLKNFYY